MKIAEIKPGAHIELYAKIIEKFSLRKLWKCFKCGRQGVWIKTSEFSDECPNCKAEISTKPGQGLWLQDLRSVRIEDDTGTAYLDLWHDDAFKYKEGDHIHLMDGYAKKNNNSGMNVSRGRDGHLRKTE